MKKKIETEKAPSAIGPYSQAIEAGNMIYLSGQIPLDPASMTLVEGDVQVQTEKVMENLAELGMEPIMSAATRRSHARTGEAAIQPADGINPSFEDELKLLSEKVVKGLNSS